MTYTRDNETSVFHLFRIIASVYILGLLWLVIVFQLGGVL